MKKFASPARTRSTRRTMTREPSGMKVIVAITGASGAIFGIRVLEQMNELGVETHLIVSKWGARTIELETDYSLNQVCALATRTYAPEELDAPISSGSYPIDGMIVSPCSMKTLAAIRHGMSCDLIGRAADVAVKERRRLVLMVRETPLSPIHLENMLDLSRMGVVIMPPAPAFYCRPASIEELVDQTAARAIAQLGIEHPARKQWDNTVCC